MGFIIFDRPDRRGKKADPRPLVSISHSKRLTFNRTAATLLRQRTLYFTVAYDREVNRMALRANTADNKNAYKISAQNCLGLSNALTWIGYNAKTTQRFLITEKDGLFEIDLNKPL